MQRLRSSPRRRVPTKLWNPIFSTHRPLVDIPLVLNIALIPEFKRGTLDYFLQDVGSAIQSWKKDALQESLYSSSPSSLQPARARLDDRAHGSGKRRDYEQEWLTPGVLRELLLADRFGCSTSDGGCLPDADRRLIYINQLSAEYILALVDTVHQHQMHPLRDAIAKHVEFETSVRVHMTPPNVFNLEFHLPFQILRETVATSSAADALHNTDMRDVSYLQHQRPHDRRQQSARRFVICKAHASIAICGWDNFKWVGWAFINAPLDPKIREDEDNEDDEDGQGDEPEDVEEDYFAVDGNGQECLVQDANAPIWDPRRYWLRIVELRVLRILEEWVQIVQFVEKGVQAWKDKRARELITNHKSDDQAIIDQLFEETATTIQILGELRRNIQKTLRVWTTFTGPSGDYRYFSDLRDPDSLSAFRNLKAAFKSLDDLQYRLRLLDGVCQESQVILSMYQERLSNRLSCQSQSRAEQANELNRKTNEISHKIHILNRRSTEAARETTEAARETSRGTRVNVLLFGITTPLVLVLQYFGADRDIFHFDRTPRTFAISLTVICLALSILTYLLSNLDRLHRLVLRKMGRKNGHGGYGDTDDIELVPPAV